MKLKPIEAGCKAVIVNMGRLNQHLNGLSVKVVSLSAKDSATYGQPIWDVIGNFHATSLTGTKLKNEGSLFEKNLLRIDGDDFFNEGDHSIYKIKEKSV